MNYTFFAVSMYIVMRGLQVLLEDHMHKKWAKNLIKIVAILMLYTAFSSMAVWYYEGIDFLGFDPSN